MPPRRVSTRKSNSAPAASSAATPPPPPALTPHPWFLTDELMSPEEYDKIKASVPRDIIVAKMIRLGAPGTSGNLLTVRNKLRSFLEKNVAQQGITPPPPPTPVGTKRSRRGQTPQRRQRETRFSQEAGSSDMDTSGVSSPGLQQPAAVLNLTPDLLMASLQSMSTHLAVPLPPWSKKIIEAPIIHALVKGLSWLDFEKLQPGMFFILAAKILYDHHLHSVAVVEPFETLYNDGYFVLELVHKVRASLGTGQQLCSVTVKIWEHVEGHVMTSITSNLFLGANKEFQFDRPLPVLLVARMALDAQFNLEYKNTEVVFDREGEHLNSVRQYDTASTAVQRQSKAQSLTDDYPLTIEKTAGVDKYGMRALYSEFDGKFLKYFSKITDIATRYKETRVAFRMTHVDVFIVINQGKGELDFSINDAFCLLISSGNSWSGPLLYGQSITDANFNGLENTKRYNVLKRLPQLVNVKIYRLLLTEGWAVTHQSNGAMTYAGSVSLSTFASDPSEFSTRTVKKDSFGDKVFLVEVMKNLENYLVFIFGMIYDGICKEIMESLQFGTWSQQNWDLAYIRYSMEKVLFKTFLEVKSASRDSYLKQYPEYDICLPGDIAKLLRKRFSDLCPTVEESTSFQQTFLDPHQKAALFGGYNHDYPRSTASTITSINNGLREGAADNNKTIWCVYDVYRQAGLLNSKTGAALSCTKGASCPFIHGNFLSLPRKEQQSYIDRWTSTNSRGFQRTPVPLGKELLRSLDKLRSSSGTSSVNNGKQASK